MNESTSKKPVYAGARGTVRGQMNPAGKRVKNPTGISGNAQGDSIARDPDAPAINAERDAYPKKQSWNPEGSAS